MVKLLCEQPNNLTTNYYLRYFFTWIFFNDVLKKNSNLEITAVYSKICCKELNFLNDKEMSIGNQFGLSKNMYTVNCIPNNANCIIAKFWNIENRLLASNLCCHLELPNKNHIQSNYLNLILILIRFKLNKVLKYDYLWLILFHYLSRFILYQFTYSIQFNASVCMHVIRDWQWKTFLL